MSDATLPDVNVTPTDTPFQPSDLSRPSQELDNWWSNAYNRVTGGQGGKADQWLRKINLTVYDAKGQNSGAGIDLSNLRIEFTVDKMTSQSPNLLTARVYNLSPQTAQRVSAYRRVVLAAGYQDGNFGVIFDGTVVLYVKGKETAVDTYLEIFAGDQDQAINNAVVTLTWPAGTTPTQKAKDAIATMQGVKLGDVPETKNEPKTLRASSYCGMARDCIRDQMNAIEADFYIDDGTAHIAPRRGYRQGEQVNLAPDTGLVGMPRVTPSGIEATCLLNPKLRLGGLVGIQSTLLTNVPFVPGGTRPFSGIPTPFAATGSRQFGAVSVGPTGQYKILLLRHFGDTRQNPWYSNIVGAAIGSNGELIPYSGDALKRSVALLGGTPAFQSTPTSG